MSLNKNKLRMLVRRMLLEQAGDSISGSTTIEQLVSMGLITQERADAMIDRYNSMLGKQTQKAATEAAFSSNIDIARRAIAYYISRKHPTVSATSTPADIQGLTGATDDFNRPKVFTKKKSESMLAYLFEAIGKDLGDTRADPGRSGSWKRHSATARKLVDAVFDEFVKKGIFRKSSGGGTSVRYGAIDSDGLSGEAGDISDLVDPNFFRGSKISEFKELEDDLIDIDDSLLETEEFEVADEFALEEEANQATQEEKSVIDDYIMDESVDVELGESVEFGGFDYDGDIDDGDDF
jgi:hypothetical protein